MGLYGRGFDRAREIYLFPQKCLSIACPPHSKGFLAVGFLYYLCSCRYNCEIPVAHIGRQTVKLPPLRGVVSFYIRKKEQVSLSCFIFLTLLHFAVHLFHLDMIPYYTAMAALIFPGIITMDATRPDIGIVGGIIAGILA